MLCEGELRDAGLPRAELDAVDALKANEFICGVTADLKQIGHLLNREQRRRSLFCSQTLLATAERAADPVNPRTGEEDNGF